MDLETGFMLAFAIIGLGCAVMVGGVIWLLKTGRASFESCDCTDEK